MERMGRSRTGAGSRLLMMVLGLGLCALLLMGCQSLTGGRRDRLVLSLLGDPKTFNPVLVTDAGSGAVLSPIFEGLLSVDGVTGELIPNLAEQWKISDGGKRIEFILRPGLQWSDGVPLTADDVMFSFAVITHPRVPSSLRDVLRIGENRVFPTLTKLDQRRVVFQLPETFAPFLRAIGGMEVLPRHILGDALKNTNSKGEPQFLQAWSLQEPLANIIGTGPYLMRTYRPGERVIYDRNPNYWKKGQPFINGMVFQILENLDTWLLRFRSRELDVYSLRPEDFELLKIAERRDRFKIYNSGPTTTQLFLMYNLNQGRDPETNRPFVDPIKSRWFNSLPFRQAIAHAINRPRMVDTIFRGLGELQNSPIPPISPYYLAPEQGLKVYDYDLERAKKLLQEAGFRYDAQGRLRDADNNEVRFTVQTNAGNTVRAQVGSQIKESLEQIGITVDFNAIDFNVLIEKMDRSKQWEAIIMGFGSSVEPHSLINLWATDGNLHIFNQGAKLGEPAIPGYESAPWEQEIEALMIAGAREVDEAKRRQIYAQYQQKIQENLPLTYLVAQLSLTAVRDRLEGVRPSVLGGVLWNIDELKLAE
ncbi:MAG: ABC transporter substrate-binding protein [Oscillatoriales cyanobacterium SM2_2_1]|nr:ABC transporter substrate-binding protein [Oscillatoriales cyanobacterium SM2_2_1]